MEQLVLTEAHGTTATVTLNRPDAHNAINTQLIAELRQAISALRSDDRVRVCTFRGAGDVFCAGMDLDVVRGDAATMSELLLALADALVELRSLPLLTVAVVRSAAIGGGCGLASVCDFTITHADARIGYPTADLGLCPAVVAAWLLRRIGPGHARSMLLRGGPITGREAHAIGLVTDLVDTADQLDQRAADLADQLAHAVPQSTRATKAWLNFLDGSMNTEIARKGARVSSQVMSDDGVREHLRKAAGSAR
ncbi:MAG: enoyl-CoA hydratase/isomerase family protein [Phycisphaerales bacterium]|nr:enoyl-CoA hydratase/isomerase family protein [Phycisphaerales bacterium]